LMALAGLSGCGSSGGSAAQNGPPSGSYSGAPSPSPSCSTSAFRHRSGHVGVSQQTTVTTALVSVLDIPDPDIGFDELRPADQENVIQQDQAQKNWAQEGINEANDDPLTSQPGNSLQEESDAVAEEEEKALWQDDAADPDTFSDYMCENIATLESKLGDLDSLNSYCADILQKFSVSSPFGGLCNAVQDANNQFDLTFPCTSYQVTQWLLDTLSDVFCKTAAPSG
jgi:hypothetical protein